MISSNDDMIQYQFNAYSKLFSLISPDGFCRVKIVLTISQKLISWGTLGKIIAHNHARDFNMPISDFYCKIGDLINGSTMTYRGEKKIHILLISEIR